MTNSERLAALERLHAGLLEQYGDRCKALDSIEREVLAMRALIEREDLEAERDNLRDAVLDNGIRDHGTNESETLSRTIQPPRNEAEAFRAPPPVAGMPTPEEMRKWWNGHWPEGMALDTSEFDKAFHTWLVSRLSAARPSVEAVAEVLCGASLLAGHEKVTWELLNDRARRAYIAEARAALSMIPPCSPPADTAQAAADAKALDEIGAALRADIGWKETGDRIEAALKSTGRKERELSRIQDRDTRTWNAAIESLLDQVRHRWDTDTFDHVYQEAQALKRPEPKETK